MKAFLPVLCALVVCAPQISFADQKAVEFKAKIVVEVSVNHLLYVPEVKDGEKLPLLVFLHGAGERGNDLDRLKRHGPPKLIEGGKKFPFIVASPQCSSRSWWKPEAVNALVDKLIKEQPVDTDRIYLTGLSMGGFGSFATAAKYPNRFAAVAPICGGGDPRTAGKLKDIPFWVFHGDADRVVRISQSQGMVDAIREHDGNVKFTVYEGVNHDSWTQTYDNPKLYEWFLKHRLSDRTKEKVAEIPTGNAKELGFDPATLGKIDDVVEGMIEEKRIAGAVTLVARKGKIVQSKAFGKRDVEADLPMELDTIFRFYSMTKPIVSTATMMLVEEGKLELDAPVSKYIKELGGLKVYKSGSGDAIEVEAAKRDMTVRDLLRHTAGLTYGFFGNTAIDQQYRAKGVMGGDLNQLVRRLNEISLLYQPGEKWVYSVASDVLGRLVEVASGESLDKFFQMRIFDPLDMKDTSFQVPEAKISRFASSYSRGLRLVDGKGDSRFTKTPRMLSGGGGLLSTARDYLRFCQMILNEGELNGRRLLKAETVRDMTKNHLPESAMPIFGNRTGVGFGLGFSVRVAATNPVERVGEFGWGGAASTHFWISPKDDLIVIALSQSQPFSDRLERAIKPIVYAALSTKE
ncbi:MAG: alpha/beta fold hydrolase [Planctomycetota bacterium]